MAVEYKDKDFYFLYSKKIADKGLTTHKWQEHSFHEIMYVAEGEMEYAVESRQYVLKEGDVLLVDAGNYHFEREVIRAPITIYCLGFFPSAMQNPSLAHEIFERGERFSLINNTAFPKILDAAKDKLELSRANAPQFVKTVIEATLFILADLNVEEEKGEEIKNVTVRKIITYVNENLPNIKTVEDISNAMFFSASYVRAIFKKEMKIGIMEYVRNKRILLAHRKMKHGGKPTEIYAECGFSNYPSFYRSYCAYFGYTPKMVKKL